MRIRQAAIQAPPLGKYTLPERVEISIRCQLGGTANPPLVLSEWMDSQGQSYDTYLVCRIDKVFAN